MAVNLNDLAAELTAAEGLKESVSIAQVKELLGILGRRWREAPPKQALDEFLAISERAGQ
jgi:hypothetical protein